MKSFPGITIITPLYISDHSIVRKMIASIRMQDYPKKKIEHIAIDGGADQKTLEIVKKSGARILTHHDLKNRAQARTAIGIRKAQHELLLFLETDNILVGRKWLQDMVRPFQDDKTLVCSFSAYNGYLSSMSIVGRYFSYIGANDVLLCYLHKSEKMARDHTTYHLGTDHQKKNGYTHVLFDPESLPTLGDNGHMARKKYMLDVMGDDEDFKHVDVFMDIVKRGYRAFAVVDNSVIHVTDGNIIDLLRRRIGYKKVYYDSARRSRSYYVFNPRSIRDIFKMVIFILCAVTFVQPLFRSLQGYRYNQDIAWFLHVPVTFLTVIFYAYSEIRYGLKRFISL